jgi:excisionase family DNA binding protein
VSYVEANRIPPDPSPRAPRRPLTRADVMTVAEVCELLALPPSTVYDLARRGELPCARLGRTLRFVREDVEARLRGW